jgi:hypothetical protein
MRNNDLGRLIACAALAMVTLTFATHASAQPLPPTSPPQIAPALVPAHVVDLMTADGIGTFGAQWKTTEAKIVEGPALPNAMPGYKTSYDISPRAGEAGFDDSSWPTIDAKGLADRRGGGKVSFLWFRTNLTIPAKIGNFETAGAKAVSPSMWTITRRCGSMGRCRAGPASRARPPSRASTSRTASYSPIPSRWVISSRLPFSGSTGRFRWHRRISCGSAKLRSNSTSSRLGDHCKKAPHAI